MIFDLIAGFIQDVVFYHVGLGFLRIVTFGRYPGKELTDIEKSKVIVTGWLVSAALITLFWLTIR